jgi:transposase
MLRALVGGATDAAALAQLAQRRMREKIPQLEQALSGHFAAHQQILVGQQLVHIESLETLIERVSHEIAVRLQAEQEAIEILQTNPGIGRRIAEIVVAEVGPDLTRLSLRRPPGLVGRAVPWE